MDLRNSLQEPLLAASFDFFLSQGEPQKTFKLQKSSNAKASNASSGAAHLVGGSV